jgi:hypothetical protein
VATPDELPAPLRRCFGHEQEVAAPNRDQRRMLLAGLFGCAGGPDLSDAVLDDAAAQTAGMYECLRGERLRNISLLRSKRHPTDPFDTTVNLGYAGQHARVKAWLSLLVLWGVLRDAACGSARCCGGCCGHSRS